MCFLKGGHQWVDVGLATIFPGLTVYMRRCGRCPTRRDTVIEYLP